MRVFIADSEHAKCGRFAVDWGAQLMIKFAFAMMMTTNGSVLLGARTSGRDYAHAVSRVTRAPEA